MAKKSGRAVATPPFETDELRRELSDFFQKHFFDPDSGVSRSVGGYTWGVYLFYDYDGEPIYVGQTREKLSGRVGRHLTNQRTDAVAMSVLDPFEVFEIEVWPLPQFEEVKSKHPAFAHAKEYLNALEFYVHEKAVKESRFNAILNEKDPERPSLKIILPPSMRGRVVSEKVRELRSHSDVRIARRAQIISRLSQTISERQVQGGLRRTLLTQVRRLRWLAEQRYLELGGEKIVEKGSENDTEESGD